MVQRDENWNMFDSPRPFLLSFLSIPDVLCDPTDLIWRQGTPFEAITGCTAFIKGFPT